jgi:uncharacterized membrane protein
MQHFPDFIQLKNRYTRGGVVEKIDWIGIGFIFITMEYPLTQENLV